MESVIVRFNSAGNDCRTGPRLPSELVSASDPTPFYAHSLPGRSRGEWELLETHARSVAQQAAEFAGAFGAAECGFAAGFFHDAGKATAAFQHRLDGGSPTSHSAEGAAYWCAAADPNRVTNGATRVLIDALAIAIAGHHAGLPNVRAVGGRRTPLEERLEAAKPVVRQPFADEALPISSFPTPLSSKILKAPSRPFRNQFFARMMLSCLVDSDRLQTEAFYAKAAGVPVSRGWSGERATLIANLARKIAQFGPPKSDVDRLRAKVAEAARAAAVLAPGFFSLTVPTGGGKTLSAMDFALRHLEAHDLSRVIYVAPFTAILEQTADVLRDALGDASAILEHHSGFEPSAVDDDDDERATMIKAAENWDRPVIVTTAVQLFESLFAADTRRCRKVHRMARAVIVLDEAQALPLPVLRPCVAALAELVRAYGASVVLCTATQPALTRRAGASFPEAIDGVREIAPDPPDLQRRLERVRVEVAGRLRDTDVAERLSAAGCGLAIVNARAHARVLFEALDVPGKHHLTTAMTGQHRRAVLARVRDDLKAKRPAIVVATSLIEAGVDISFPLVMRAVAGLDSLAQAAGRCNRNGELGPQGGAVVVFEPEEQHTPPPELARFAEVARTVMARHENPLSQEAVADYFAQLYWQKGEDDLDARRVRLGEREIKGVLRAIEREDGGAHASVGEAFRLIEETMRPVIIGDDASPYGAPDDLIDRLHHAEKIGGLARRLQPYTVAVPRRARMALIAAGAAQVIRPEEFDDDFVLLTNPWLYTDATGLDWSDPTFREATSNIV